MIKRLGFTFTLDELQTIRVALRDLTQNVHGHSSDGRNDAYVLEMKIRDRVAKATQALEAQEHARKTGAS